jgi:chromosome segregation ATPase
MDSLNQEVQLARQQCEDLKAYRLSLYEETEKIQKVSMKSVRDKLIRVKNQRQKIAPQLKAERENIESLKDKITAFDNQKSQMILEKLKQQKFFKDFSSDKGKPLEASDGPDASPEPLKASKVRS